MRGVLTVSWSTEANCMHHLQIQLNRYRLIILQLTFAGDLSIASNYVLRLSFNVVGTPAHPQPSDSVPRSVQSAEAQINVKAQINVTRMTASLAFSILNALYDYWLQDINQCCCAKRGASRSPAPELKLSSCVTNNVQMHTKILPIPSDFVTLLGDLRLGAHGCRVWSSIAAYNTRQP